MPHLRTSFFSNIIFVLKTYFASLILIILLPLYLSGQPDTLHLPSGFTQVQVSNGFSYFNTATEITADSALLVFKHTHTQIKQLDKINFGPINGFYWIKGSLKNDSGKDLDLYLEIRQPHIYRMKFYQVLNGSLVALSETGIKYNFFQRPTPHRYFDFPITIRPGETVTILLMVHHLNSLSLPVHVLTQATVHTNNYTQNLIWGYWLGFLSFCSLFAIIASLLLRKMVFFWYFLYILSAALYGFTDQGFAFQYLFPGWEDMAALIIIQLAVYNFVFLVKFSQGLLETKKYLPIVHRILNGIVYFLVVLLIAGVVLQKIMFQLSTIVLPVVNLVTITGLILLAYSGIKSFFTNRIIAVFYLTAYLTLVAAGIFSTLNYGFGLYQYFGPNPILIAYFLEAMILSVALVILFRQVQNERTRLMEKVNTQQKEMYTQYINGIEKERSRIAGELHDDVGSRLSYLKQLMVTHSTESIKTADQLEQLIKDVRQLSHDLAPPLAHVSGLIPLIEKLISETRLATGLEIKFQQHNYKEVLVNNQIQQVYRIIQEALNNILKHAQATRVDVQVFGHEGEVNISIEDNGKGFNPSEVPDGLGLNQMKIRTESLGGRIEINSHPGKGTLVLISVPIH